MSGGPIVVIGGTGAVGRELVDLLAGGDDELVVVGRDGRRAADLAADVARRRGGRVSARRGDVTSAADRRAVLDGAGVVVTSVERANVEVAAEALAMGADVVDISASAGVVAGIVGLDDLARRHGRSALVSVGLAPGLTNLLALACVDGRADTARVDITILLGLGDRHGADAVRWTLDRLAEPGEGAGEGAGAGRRPVDAHDADTHGAIGGDDAGTRPIRTGIPGFGVRTAHPFPFSDQVALRARLGVPVTTRLTFDSRALTAAAFAARPLIRRLPRAALARAATRAHVGTDRWAIAVTATASDGRSTRATATGRRQSHATAVITAHAVRRLLAGAVAPGAHHIDVLDVAAALAEAEAAGIAIDLPTRWARPSPVRRRAG